jgi:hypothetical protein
MIDPTAFLDTRSIAIEDEGLMLQLLHCNGTEEPGRKNSPPFGDTTVIDELEAHVELADCTVIVFANAAEGIGSVTDDWEPITGSCPIPPIFT